MKYLITGSNGFIGRIFSLWCEKQGINVTHVDLKDGYNFVDPGWSSKLPEGEIDVVVHLAQSLYYQDFPNKVNDIFQVNVASTIELLDWSRRHSAKRFIYVSTGTVYENTKKKLDETSTTRPVSMYAASKLSAEMLSYPYSSYFKIVIPRLFGVYGPSQGKMLIHDMVERVKTGKEITLAGGKGIYLTPIYIDDCVQVLYTLASIQMEDGITVVNIAGDEVLSLAQIVNEIGNQIGKKPIVKVTVEEPKWLCADNTFLKTFYKQSFISFSEGISRVVNQLESDMKCKNEESQ